MQKVQLSRQQIGWVKQKLQNGLTLSHLALDEFDDYHQIFVEASDFFATNNFEELNLDTGHGDDIQHRTDGVSEFLNSYFSAENRTLLVEGWLARPSDPYLHKFNGNLMICEQEVYHRASLNAPPGWELERFINRGHEGTGLLIRKEILVDDINLEELKNLYQLVDGFFIEIFDHENFLFFGKGALIPQPNL